MLREWQWHSAMPGADGSPAGGRPSPRRACPGVLRLVMSLLCALRWWRWLVWWARGRFVERA